MSAFDVVAFPFHDWVKLEAEGWYRRDVQVILELSRRPDIGKVLVVNRPSSFPVAARAIARRQPWHVRRGRRLAGGRGWTVRSGDGRLFTLDIFIPDLTRGLRLGRGWWPVALGEPRTRAAVLAAMDHLSIANPVVWAFTPISVPLAASLPRRALAFDAIDDWLLHPEMEPYRAAARAGYDQAAREADLITCVAEDLVGRFDGRRARALWVPNGVDAGLFAHGSPPADIEAVPRPRAGYIGVLEARVDVDLLEEVGRRLPHIQFCFVGPTERTRSERLARLGNFHLLGKRDFKDMPGYLAAFDVCLIPHVVDGFTRSMNPLKLYEYLAAGRRVVSTPVAGIDAFRGLIDVASTPADFAAAIERAVADPETGGAERAASVAGHSWRARADVMVAALTEVASLA